MYENFGKLVDMVIDGGPGGMHPSTVIDCTEEPYRLVRQGAGVWEEVV
jgi:tRNA A37 threonylcarbamoyladenosine synthetase subunit TsaC/SUA5/YrdC